MGTFWDELCFVVLLAVEASLLGVGGHRPQVLGAGRALKAGVLTVQPLLRLHGAAVNVCAAFSANSLLIIGAHSSN